MMGRPKKEDRVNPLALIPGALTGDEREAYRHFDFVAHFSPRGGEETDESAEVMHAMLYFVNEVREGRTPPVWLLEMFANRFDCLLMGMPQRAAMPLPWLPQFTPEELLGRESVRSFALANHVFGLCTTHPVMPLQKAKQKVGKIDGASFQTVDRAWLANIARLWITNPAERLTKPG